MRTLRVTAVLLALLLLPVFASQALADFVVYQLTENFINPLTEVGASSDTLVMAFEIPASEDGETLTTVGVKSFIERSFATERVRLWAEDGTTPGWQRTEDQLLKIFITSTHPTGFETNDVITFIGLNYELTAGDTFYVTLDMYNSYVHAQPAWFHQTGLEVVIEPGFIEFENGEMNVNYVRNDGWHSGPPPWFDPFILVFDTQGPVIDSMTWEHVYDWNSDGRIGLGDSIVIIGWGLSNPDSECTKMEVDWSWYSGMPNDWRELDDTPENNGIFRKAFGLTEPVQIDSAGCPVNLLVRAWDNVCNWDTLRGEICGTMDLDPPTVSVVYEWYTDYDTSFACIGIGDKVFIEAIVPGDDIISVVAWMDSAGIDELMQHNMPLPYKGGGVYDTIWTVTEPPIHHGKDKDNTVPPAKDDDYRVWVVACDDAGNCDTAVSNLLNRTLDTRVPRPIGFNCPDSVPCALHARSLSGGIIELYWDQDCDENDAFYYYVWASFEGAPFELIGATNAGEQSDPDFYFWRSEPLSPGCWQFKIESEDNCNNLSPFSCTVTAPLNACKAFLTPSKLNLTRNAEHTFMIHLHPCQPACVSKGDSAEVYVDVDGSNTFDADELYPAVVNSPSVVVKVYCSDLVDNDPGVFIRSVNNTPVSDTLGNDVVLYLDTFIPPGKGPKFSASPAQFSLSQNHPNPFNPTCEIGYALPADCHVTLSIYSLLGQKVRVLVDEHQGAGNKSVIWDGKDDQGQEVTSGVYFYSMKAGEFAQSKRMVLLK